MSGQGNRPIDNPRGEVFYRLHMSQVNPDELSAVVRDIALQFASLFVLRMGFRGDEDGMYWLCLNTPTTHGDQAVRAIAANIRRPIESFLEQRHKELVELGSGLSFQRRLHLPPNPDPAKVQNPMLPRVLDQVASPVQAAPEPPQTPSPAPPAKNEEKGGRKPGRGRGWTIGGAAVQARQELRKGKSTSKPNLLGRFRRKGEGD